MSKIMILKAIHNFIKSCTEEAIIQLHLKRDASRFRCSSALKMLCFCIHFAIKYYLCV